MFEIMQKLPLKGCVSLESFVDFSVANVLQVLLRTAILISNEGFICSHIIFTNIHEIGKFTTFFRLRFLDNICMELPFFSWGIQHNNVLEIRRQNNLISILSIPCKIHVEISHRFLLEPTCFTHCL